MNLDDLARHPSIIRLGMVLSRSTPEALGQRMSWWMAGILCSARPTVHQIVQSNLRQVLGPTADRSLLDSTTRKVFYTAIRSYYDLFRAVSAASEKVVAAVRLTEEERNRISSLWKRPGGGIIVFPHMGSFDLMTQVATAYLPEVQLFTLPDPPPGFELTNALRRHAGVKVTPLSSESLREAIRRLRSGGVVALAGDRPVSDLDEPFSFFGRLARVPSGHVRLALRTGAAVVVTYCVFDPRRKQHTMRAESPLDMLRTGNREEEIQVNMRRVLDVLENVIRAWSEQWQMLVPVWPDLLET